MPLPAVPYDPGVERVSPEEGETLRQLSAVFGQIQEHVLEKAGEAKHGTHAKATALLKGTLVVPDDLPAGLAQGLFGRPGRYGALVRFSQGPSENLSDKASGQRGMSVKILGVHGPHVAGSREATTQDWVLSVNDRAFTNADAAAFLRTFRYTGGKATFVPEGVIVAASVAARATEAALETVGLGSAHLRFFGQPPDHPASGRYFSQAPMRHGDHIAQLSLVPSERTLAAIGDPRLAGGDDRFRDAMIAYFADNDAEFEVRVQLCTDLAAMPVEDASVAWPEEGSPYRTVARLVLPKQDAFSEERRRFFDDRLSFNPIHALEEHRPLGSIMRARMAIYVQAQDFRQRSNGASPVEPRSLAEVPD